MMSRMFSAIVDRVGSADDGALLAELREIEGRRREDAARECAVLSELERRKTYRVDGHATMWGLLRSALHWSDGDCRGRMRLARFVADRPEVGEALFEHWVSVANAGELARAAFRVEAASGDEMVDPTAERELGELMRLAERSEHDDLRTHVRGWERRSIRELSDAEAADADQRRNAHVHIGRDGGEIVGEFGLLDAIEIAEIFGAYVDAEWHADWHAAVGEFGDAATPTMMQRTDAQRRADALRRVFVDAASRPSGSRAPDPIVNVHVDHTTFVGLLAEAELLPERTADPFDDPAPHVSARFARTDHGHPVDHATVLRLLLDAHVRMVIRDDEGVPIRWGRTRRLFDGAARDAVRALSTRCTHPGCRVPTNRTETDHTVDWSMGGPTDPANGNPRCRRHNNAKNRGFTVWRDPQGDWHTYRPDGTEIR